jgi:ribose-phosphate pyrophosphokinase
MHAITVLGFPDYAEPSQRLGALLGARQALVGVHRFPDGESRVTLPPALAGHLVFCRSLDRPNDKLIELLLAARTARDSGATTLTLVAPYLCYMRQDIAFHPGEAISQRIIGRMLADMFDNVITVDPHLHRIARLDDVLPARNALALSAAPLLGDFLCEHVPGALLLGPDAESLQWVGAIAESHGFDFGVCIKVRSGDRDVTVELSAVDCSQRNVVLVDDMASTGCTLAAAAAQCLARGARSVDVLVVHGLFFGDAVDQLRQSGVGRIWSTDSIPHSTSVIPLAAMLAAAVRRLDEGAMAARPIGNAEQEDR